MSNNCSKMFVTEIVTHIAGLFDHQLLGWRVPLVLFLPIRSCLHQTMEASQHGCSADLYFDVAALPTRP